MGRGLCSVSAERHRQKHGDSREGFADCVSYVPFPHYAPFFVLSFIRMTVAFYSVFLNDKVAVKVRAQDVAIGGGDRLRGGFHCIKMDVKKGVGETILSAFAANAPGRRGGQRRGRRGGAGWRGLQRQWRP